MEYHTRNIFLTVLCVLVLITMSKCFKYEDKKKLLEYLFDNSRYDKSVRPVKDSSTVTKVNVSQNVRAITNVDVATGFMCSYSFLTLSWKDELLIWNSSQYGGITEVTLPSDKCWSPQLEKTYAGACKDTDVEDKDQVLNITLSNNGFVVQHQAKSIGAMCLIDMKMFPFDKHVCMHQFYSSKYTFDELIVQINQKSIVDEIVYNKNQEWSVIETHVYVTNYTEPLSSLSTSYGTSLITIKRRPTFIMVNSFAPAWFVSVLILFAPLVPPDCERLSFSITTYLAMIFMVVSFAPEIPRNSIEIILLSQGILAFSAISTIGIIWSIFIVCLSKISTTKKQVPDILRKLISRSCKKNTSDGKYSVNDEDETEKHEERNVITSDVENMTDGVGWYEVSRFLDKIYFVSSVLFVGVATLINFRNIEF